jgi:dipeptide/tripeptide permease
MNTAHWHLLFNHFPIIGNIFGLFLLVLAFALKSETFRRSAYALFILTGLLAIPAYLTGEPAEEVVEHIAGISHPIIHQHEDAALFGLLASALTGLAAIAALFGSLKNSTWKGIPAIIVLLLSVGTAAVMYRVGNSGGQIRHTEIRKDNNAATGPSEAQQNNEKDDD